MMKCAFEGLNLEIFQQNAQTDCVFTLAYLVSKFAQGLKISTIVHITS